MFISRIAIPLTLCFLVGCASQVQRPTATVRGMNVKELSGKGFTMVFDLELHNPNAFALPLAKADYSLKLADKNVLDGNAQPEGSIPANGSLPVSFPVSLTFENLLAAGSALRANNGDVPYALDAGIEFTTPKNDFLSGPVRVPIKYAGTLHTRDLLKDPTWLLKKLPW